MGNHPITKPIQTTNFEEADSGGGGETGADNMGSFKRILCNPRSVFVESGSAGVKHASRDKSKQKPRQRLWFTAI